MGGTGEDDAAGTFCPLWRVRTALLQAWRGLAAAAFRFLLHLTLLHGCSACRSPAALPTFPVPLHSALACLLPSLPVEKMKGRGGRWRRVGNGGRARASC